MIASAGVSRAAMAVASVVASAACAVGERGDVRAAPAPAVTSVNVGGGFWSPRLRAVEQAMRRCGTGAATERAPITERASMTERALFEALASLSLDGMAFQHDVPATCAASCVRPAWDGQDARGCASLAAIASLKDMIWRVDGGTVPTVTVALIADSELSFTLEGIRWHIDQGTDYPWSNHVGFTVSHRAPSGAGAGPETGGPQSRPEAAEAAKSGEGAMDVPADRALDVRVQLPDWIDPATVRISARGRMLAASDFAVDGRTLTVRGPWADGDRMHMSFAMRPRRVTAGGGVEIWRGPLRYVAEAVDQPGSALADTTIAPGDGLRDVPFVLGAIVPGDPVARQADPVTQRPSPQPDAAASSAPNGIMAVMVERRARGLPDLVLVPLAFAGNRGDMPRVGTFAPPAP